MGGFSRLMWTSLTLLAAACVSPERDPEGPGSTGPVPASPDASSTLAQEAAAPNQPGWPDASGTKTQDAAAQSPAQAGDASLNNFTLKARAQ